MITFLIFVLYLNLTPAICVFAEMFFKIVYVRMLKSIRSNRWPVVERRLCG